MVTRQAPGLNLLVQTARSFDRLGLGWSWKRPSRHGGLAEAFHLKRFLQRDINAHLSGGEIKRSELFQLLLTQPQLALLDEPDSGIDLETLPVVGQMVNHLLARPGGCPAKRNSALIVTHTSYILDYVAVDKAHIMLAGRIDCSGQPRLLIDEIRQRGYEGCVKCMPRQEWAL